jgi:hypothetical protein
VFQTVSELVEIARVPSAKQPLVLGDGARVQSTVNEKRVDATHWNRSLLGPRRASPPFQEEAQKAAAVEKELVTGTAQLHAVIDGLEALGHVADDSVKRPSVAQSATQVMAFELALRRRHVWSPREETRRCPMAV